MFIGFRDYWQIAGIGGNGYGYGYERYLDKDKGKL